MFQTFRNAWKIPELKNRLLFTLAILVVYRLGCAIPVPFVSGSALTQMFANGDMLSYLNMMSGGALARCTLFALGVTPYINASIIVQLLTVAIPSLENLAKEADGQQKLQQINRYAGAVIALIMGIGYYFVTTQTACKRPQRRRSRHLCRCGHHRDLRGRCSVDHLVRRADR